MPNEFEKQVQQMMDELKLVPSEPVWQKVEMQIRKKKDRRRLILWISFLILLLGGGLWIGIDHYSNRLSHNESNNQTKDDFNKTSVQNSPATPKKIDDRKNTGNANTITGKSEHPIEKANKVTGTKNTNIGFDEKLVVQEKLTQKVSRQKENLVEEKKDVAVTVEENEMPPKAEEVIVRLPIEKLKQLESDPRINAPAEMMTAFKPDSEKIKPAISNPDSVQQDTAAVKKTDVKKYVASKWKLNLVATSGLSGLNNLDFLSVFDGLKSMDALYQSAPGTVTNPGATYYGPSPIKKGISFSIGASAQKHLSKRLVFSAGLQYNYYSNSILVGNKIRRDTVFRYSYSVSQYFTSNSATVPLSLERYHNHYHFISVPLAIDWQMFKKLPLSFHTGLSVQQMIQTNALTFDYYAQAYYHNNKAFNKTLVFTEYGFNYTIPFAKHSLVLGPEFQYSLSALEKNNSAHHLFSYGLKAQLQFKKK